MAQQQTSLRQAWHEWSRHSERDPIDKLIGVVSNGPRAVHAIFRTLAGAIIEGNINDLRSLEYKLEKPHKRIKGHVEVTDLGGMTAAAHDRYLQVCTGSDFINERRLALIKGVNVPQIHPLDQPDAWQMAQTQIRRIMDLPKPV